MQKQRSLYHGHRFPAVVISQAVRWYFRLQLSLRDIEELMFERGVVLSYETIRRSRASPKIRLQPSESRRRLPMLRSLTANVTTSVHQHAARNGFGDQYARGPSMSMAAATAKNTLPRQNASRFRICWGPDIRAKAWFG